MPPGSETRLMSLADSASFLSLPDPPGLLFFLNLDLNLTCPINKIHVDGFELVFSEA